jgi:hypothetical protein
MKNSLDKYRVAVPIFENERNEKKRVVVIVNKKWEYHAVICVLINDSARPSVSNFPEPVYNLKKRLSDPRAVIEFTNSVCEIWCISDLLEKYSKEFQSSSQRKMEELNSVYQFSSKIPDLVIAVGTAASFPSNLSLNGSVIVGTKTFLTQCHPNNENKFSNWEKGPFNQLIHSPLNENDFNIITSIETTPHSATKNFLVPPNNPDKMGGRLLANYENVALSMVNVTDYSEYDEMDRKTITAFKKKYKSSLYHSLETTHGLIRISAGVSTPFIFISGIVDRAGHYNQDVKPKSYSQNTTGSHNAGVVLTWMLPLIDEIMRKK